MQADTVPNDDNEFRVQKCLKRGADQYFQEKSAEPPVDWESTSGLARQKRVSLGPVRGAEQARAVGRVLWVQFPGIQFPGVQFPAARLSSSRLASSRYFGHGNMRFQSFQANRGSPRVLATVQVPPLWTIQFPGVQFPGSSFRGPVSGVQFPGSRMEG